MEIFEDMVYVPAQAPNHSTGVVDVGIGAVANDRQKQ